VHLVWWTRGSGTQQIWTKRFVPGSGWTPDEQVVFSSTGSSAPSITADYNSQHAPGLAGHAKRNNDIFYKEYVPGTGLGPDRHPR